MRYSSSKEFLEVCGLYEDERSDSLELPRGDAKPWPWQNYSAFEKSKSRVLNPGKKKHKKDD